MEANVWILCAVAMENCSVKDWTIIIDLLSLPTSAQTP